MSADEKKAIHGKKMIEIKVRFWTDGIAEVEGNIVPKHCWDSGVVRASRNDSHEITSYEPIHFDSLPEILPKIEEVLKQSNIKIHHGRKSKHYITANEL